MFFQLYLKLFFLLTPFFVVSAFLSLTRSLDAAGRRAVAIKVTVAMIVIAMVLFLFGRYIFVAFGITLDAFRIGAGALLFLSALNLVQRPLHAPPEAAADEDVSVVPLALPMAVGPATTGTLLVMGAELQGVAEKAVAAAALLAAAVSVGGLLLAAGLLEKTLGRRGLIVLSKLTGFFLAALAAQIIFTGIRGFLAP